MKKYFTKTKVYYRHDERSVPDFFHETDEPSPTFGNVSSVLKVYTFNIK
jgi:hypothetical protein